LFDLVSTAYALGGPPLDGGQQPNPIASLLPFALMFLVLYLLILRPQMKKQKDQQRLVDELEKNDAIVTSGGIHGTILNIKDDILVVKIADNVKIEVSRAAVSRVKNKEKGDDKK
jgi:preprotein translocase subunit YajC